MAKYEVNDKVVFKYEDKNQIGIVTNIRSIRDGGGYDIRSEKGSGFIMVPVDPTGGGEKAKYRKTYAWIDSALTSAVVDKIETNLHVNNNIGHTRANYGPNVKLRLDGEQPGDNAVGHFERYNNFHFPPQGPRSF